MAYVISEKCTACGKCKDVCPVESISKGEKYYVIDPETCVSCGQCVDECESAAISES
jgi:ferredoxin